MLSVTFRSDNGRWLNNILLSATQLIRLLLIKKIFSVELNKMGNEKGTYGSIQTTH